MDNQLQKKAKAKAERKIVEEKAQKEKEVIDGIAEAIIKERKEQEILLAQEKAKAEAERKEKERLEELLKNQIECPYCHKQFQLKK